MGAWTRSEARAVVLCHLFMGVFVHNSAVFVAPLRKWHPAMHAGCWQRGDEALHVGTTAAGGASVKPNNSVFVVEAVHVHISTDFYVNQNLGKAQRNLNNEATSESIFASHLPIIH